MHRLMKKIFTAFCLMLFLTLPACIQAAPMPRAILRSALHNMDFSSGRYDIDLQVENPAGKLNLKDQLLLQQSPLLLQNEMTTTFAAKMIGDFPSMSFAQYTQQINGVLKSYYSAAPVGTALDSPQRVWKMTQMPVSEKMNAAMEKTLSAISNIEKLQADMNDVQKVTVMHDGQEAIELAIALDCKKIFASQSVLNAPIAPPLAGQKQDLEKLRDVEKALSKSGLIAGVVTIDKKQNVITKVKLDLSRQAQVVLPLLFGAPKQELKIGEVKKAQPHDFLNVEGLSKKPLDDVKAQLEIKIGPIKDVMELAVPEKIVKGAQDVTPKMPKSLPDLT